MSIAAHNLVDAMNIKCLSHHFSLEPFSVLRLTSIAIEITCREKTQIIEFPHKKVTEPLGVSIRQLVSSVDRLGPLPK